MRSSDENYGIITTDNNLLVTNWNEWVEVTSGIPAEKAIGVKITDLFSDMDDRGLTKRFLRALNEGTVEILSSIFHKYLYKFEIGSAGEDPVFMKQHVTIGPLKSDNGIVGLVITIEEAKDYIQFKQTGKHDHENIEHLNNNDWRIRKGAQLKLTKDANHSTIATLFKLLKNQHHDVGVLNSILLVLSQTETDIVGALLSLLEEDDVDLRIYVIQTLGDRNDPSAIPTLIQCLNDEDANIQYHAIEALGKLEAHDATDHLINIAVKCDFFVTFPAIDALTKIGDVSVVPKIMPLIDDPFFSDAVMALLGKLGEADIVGLLTKKINESDDLIVSITRTLLDINSRYEIMYREGSLIKDIFNSTINNQGINNLIKSTEFIAVDEIQTIIKVLGWIPSEKALKALTRMLGNPSVQREVIEAFVNYGNKVTDLLIDQLNASDNETRNAAAIALGRIGDPKSAIPLIKMIGENDEFTVFVIGSLAKLGVRESFEPLLENLNSLNPSIRRASIAALNSIGHPEMPKRIEKLIQSDDPLYRESAIHIAGYFGYPNCKKLIEDCIDDSDIRVVCAAIENLPFFNDQSTNQTLANLYDHGSTRIRTSVVKAATHIDNINQFKTLDQSLNDTDAWVRYYTIRTICNHLLQEHLPTLISMAQFDKAIHVRLAAIEAIGILNGTNAVSIFSKLLLDDNNDIVLTTIYALGLLETKQALTLLMPLVDDSDINKRTAVIKAISHFDVPEVIEKLYWICATETNPLITNLSIEGLSSIKNIKAVDHLIQLSIIPRIREKCISALLFQKAISLPYLVENFNNKPIQTKRTIIEFLSRVKKPEASQALIELLGNENSLIRIDAMNALYRIGNVRLREKVEYISTNDPDGFVRYHAREILKKS